MILEGFALPSKLQLKAVIPKNVGGLKDGLKLRLLVPHIQAFKVGQERGNRSRQTLKAQAKSAAESFLTKRDPNRILAT